MKLNHTLVALLSVAALLPASQADLLAVEIGCLPTVTTVHPRTPPAWPIPRSLQALDVLMTMLTSLNFLLMPLATPGEEATQVLFGLTV